MNIIKSFSTTGDKAPVLEEFEKIAKREGKEQSKLIIELIEEYVKSHSEGNPQFTLEKFQEADFKAIPTLLSTTEKWTNYIKESDDKDKTQILNKAHEVVSIIKSHFYNESKKRKKERFGID